MDVKRVPLQEQSLNKLLLNESISKKNISDVADNIIISFEDSKVVNQNNDKDEHNITCFRNLLKDNTKVLTQLCDLWGNYKLSQAIPNADQVMGDIRTTVGQAYLVMKERFTQFEGLVDNSEFNTSEKPVTSQDLQGFWDMIYFQVEDVLEKFKDLDKRKYNDWKSSASCPQPPVPKKRKLAKKRVSAISQAAQERREHARKRLAAAKAALKKETDFPLSFDAGFFKVNSPVRSVIERDKTPCSKEKRKPVTPASANFMHGRFLRCATEGTTLNLKKTLSFEDKSPIKMKMRDVPVGDNAEDPPSTQGPVSSAPSSSRKHDKSTETDMPQPSTAQLALNIITEQIQVLRCAFTDGQVDVNCSSKVNETEHKPLNADNFHGKDIKHTDTTIKDTYELRCKRLLGKSRIVEAQRCEFHKVNAAIQQSNKKAKAAMELLCSKTTEIQQRNKELRTREASIIQKELAENKDLVHLRVLQSIQEKEVCTLKKKAVEYDKICDKLKAMVACNDKQSKELVMLREECEMIRDDRNSVREAYVAMTRSKENTEESLAKLVDEREFEQVEFANEKKFLEELIAKTESALDLTKDHIATLQDKNQKMQAELNDLNSNLEQARFDSKSVQEELDITKMTARFQILEQQQEVVNCEVKLRDVVYRMTDFHQQMQRLCKDADEQKENPIEIALKTPSKSLVVSALLGVGTSNSNSPAAEGEDTVTETLFSRVADAEEQLEIIMNLSKNIVVNYEDRLTECRVVNSCLRESIDKLRAKFRSTSDSENETEILLRRRLHEVTDQRDRRTEELENEQKKANLLCERIEFLTEQNRRLKSSDRPFAR